MHFEAHNKISSPEFKQTLWQLYDAACDTTRALSPTRQFLYQDEFMDHLEADDIIKLLMYKETTVIGLLMFTKNLTHCGWLNPYFFEAAQKKLTDGKPLYYNTVMAIAQEEQGGGVNKYMLKCGYQYIFELGGVCCVDFSERTTPGGGQMGGIYGKIW